MSVQNTDGEQSSSTPRRTLRLPRFVSSEPVGLGDAITRITDAARIPQCGGCKDRAAALNRFLQFVPPDQ